MDMTLIAQTAALALPAMWLTLGVRDNLLHPDLNETYTAQVFSLERMKTDYPDDYERIKHRAITNRKVQRAAFRLVVLAELSTTIILWIGVVLLILSMLATDGVPLIGYHMPWPGIGYVETDGDGFRYVPHTYQMML